MTPDSTTTFEELYPFRSNFIELDGLRYHYLDEGEGPALVLLHGNPTWSFYYRNLVLGLRQDFRVIVPDHIGCGLSDKPSDYPYRLENHIANVERLLDHLELPELYLGVHDWGGPIGLGYAVEHAAKVRKLIVFNTTVHITRRYPWSILAGKLPLVGMVGIRCFNLFALAAARFGSKRPDKMTPAVKAGYLKPYDSFANRIATLRFVQDIPLGPGHPSWETGQRIESRLGELADTPTLICWGGQDICFTSYFLHEWQRRMPQARVKLFADAGHYVVEDAGDEILALMREFLAEG